MWPKMRESDVTVLKYVFLRQLVYTDFEISLCGPLECGLLYTEKGRQQTLF